MTADTAYCRETLESVIALLRRLAEEDNTYGKTGLFHLDLLQGADFIERHLDDEAVMTSEQICLEMK